MKPRLHNVNNQLLDFLKSLRRLMHCAFFLQWQLFQKFTPPQFFFSQAEPKSVGASGFYGKDPPLPVDLKQAFLSLNKEKKTSSEQSLHTTVTRRKKTPICSAEFGCTNPAAFQHSLTKTLYCKQHKVNSPDVVKLLPSGKAAN